MKVDLLLVTDEHLENIYQVDDATGTTLRLLPLFNATHPLAVAYDPTQHVVYWTEYTRYPSTVSIRSYSIDTNKLNIVYAETKHSTVTTLYRGINFLLHQCSDIVALLSANN